MSGKFPTNRIEPIDMSEAGDPQSLFSEEPTMKEGANLVFKEVSVKIKHKTIIHNISGVVKSGQLLAVMGPSGRSYVFFLGAGVPGV